METIKVKRIETIRTACIKAKPDVELIIWACEGCSRVYGEYVNGCVHCWDETLSREENLKKFSNRSVTARYRPIHLADVLLAMHQRLTVGKYENGVGYLLNFGGLNHWNLRTDDLEQQSDQCVAFLAELLE